MQYIYGIELGFMNHASTEVNMLDANAKTRVIIETVS
jgi:hypothetical protein